MRLAVVNSLDNRRRVYAPGAGGFCIGRDESCEIHLESKLVSRVHVRVDRAPGGWTLHVPETARNPIEVDRTADGRVRTETVYPGESTLVDGVEVLRVGNFLVELLADGEKARDGVDVSALQDLIQQLHASVLRRLDLRLGDLTSPDERDERIERLNRVLDDCLDGEFKDRLAEPKLADVMLRVAMRTRSQLYGGATRTAWSRQNFGIVSDSEADTDAIVARLGAAAAADPAGGFDAAYRAVCLPLTAAQKRYAVVSYVKKQLYDVILGLGPLEGLMASDDVREVMVVHPRLIYVETPDGVVRSGQIFPSSDSAVSVIERIVAPLGRRIDRAQPLVDARLADGSRVNAIIEPLAVKGPCITIRRFPKKRIGIGDLVDYGALTASAVALLRACVLHRCNLVVSGGTGSGKTTLLNALSSLIPPDERLVTIEDAAELRLQQEHVVSLETRPASAEGTGAYTTRDLVKNALRMRPDRIIVGECRGAETLDMLQAMNTGHSGSMTTLHANSAEDVPSRLETMVLMSGDAPLASVRRQISQAIEFVVFVERLPNGRRMVTQISEVLGLHPTTGEIEIRDVMRAVEDRGTMRLKPTGFMPTGLERMVSKKHLDLNEWFSTVKPSA